MSREHSSRSNDLRLHPEWLEDRPIQREEDDRLGFQASAMALARQLTATRKQHGSQSLTVSLEGPWGSGKSSYSHLLIQQLKSKDLVGEHPPFVVRFNVWQSGTMALSPWGALAYRIGETFYRDFHQRCLDLPKNRRITLGCPGYLAGDRDSKRRMIQIDPENAELKDSRLHWIEVAHRLSLAVPKKEWAPSLKLFADAPSKVPGRRLGWRQGGLDAFLSMGQAGLSVASGGIDDAISSTGQAASTLLQKRLIEGPAWGTDTLEFVEQLDQLLAVLHPAATSWRCILAVDDVTRLDPDELPSVLETLGYLRELRNVLVLLSLDEWLVYKLHTMGREHTSAHPPAVEQNQQQNQERARTSTPAPTTTPTSTPARAKQPAEPFLTRLVNLRTQIPQPRPGELGKMLGSYFEDLKLPVIWASAAARQLLARGIQTPRQVKRALLWLWIRLGEIGTSTMGAGRFDGSLLHLLLDIYLLSEGHGSNIDLGKWSAHRSLLLQLKVQPWDLRHWFDKNLLEDFDRLGEQWPIDDHDADSATHSIGQALTQLEERARSLAAHLRLLAMVAQLDTEHLDHCRLEARREFVQWQETLSGLSQGFIEAIGSKDQNALLTAWARLLHQVLGASTIRIFIELTSIARYFQLIDETDEDATVVLGRWFDYDGIIRVSEDPEVGQELRELAHIVLNLVNSIPGPGTSQS